jgi:hypothetical protein
VPVPSADLSGSKKRLALLVSFEGFHEEDLILHAITSRVPGRLSGWDVPRGWGNGRGGGPRESIAKATDAPSLGDKPLVILNAGSREYPGFTKKQAKRTDEQTNEFEAGRQALSENSKLVVAKNSAHYIRFDRSGLVVDAIRQVVDATQDGRRL